MSAEEKNSNRILWINGLKGVACLLVFCHHFFMTFYPGIYYGNEVASKTVSGIDLLMGYKPYGVFLNGNFAVCLFIMVSAFLYAVKTMRADISEKKEDLLSLCVQRYVRLMLSVALIGILYYILLKVLTVAGLNYIGMQSELSVPQLFAHILIFQWITYDSSVLGPLWCMYVIFLGTFISIFLSKLDAKKRWYMPFIYAILTPASMYVNQYYPAVVFGVLLADLLCYERVAQWSEYLTEHRWKTGFLFTQGFRYVAGAVIIICGLFLGGYPSYAAPDNIIYGLLSHMPGGFITIHIVGAAVLMAGLMILPKTVILSSKLINYFGNISFGVYLIHGVIINLLSYFMTDKFAALTGNYSLGVLTCFIVTTVLVIVLSHIYNKYYEKAVTKISKSIKI